MNEKWNITVNVFNYGTDDLFPYISHFSVNQSVLQSILFLSDFLKMDDEV